MEVEGAGGLEEAVGHHVVLAEEGAQGLHHLGHVGIGLVEEFVELALGLLAQCQLSSKAVMEASLTWPLGDLKRRL